MVAALLIYLQRQKYQGINLHSQFCVNNTVNKILVRGSKLHVLGPLNHPPSPLTMGWFQGKVKWDESADVSLTDLAKSEIKGMWIHSKHNRQTELT